MFLAETSRFAGAGMHQHLMFKLDQNPGGRGLRCDSDGLFLGREALLQRDRHGIFESLPVTELQKVLGRAYGDETNWESRIRSVKLVADALNKGGIAHATMTAVLMRLPDPGSVIRIADMDGLLAKAGFDPEGEVSARTKLPFQRVWVQPELSRPTWSSRSTLFSMRPSEQIKFVTSLDAAMPASPRLEMVLSVMTKLLTRPPT